MPKRRRVMLAITATGVAIVDYGYRAARCWKSLFATTPGAERVS